MEYLEVLTSSFEESKDEEFSENLFNHGGGDGKDNKKEKLQRPDNEIIETKNDDNLSSDNNSNVMKVRFDDESESTGLQADGITTNGANPEEGSEGDDFQENVEMNLGDLKRSSSYKFNRAPIDFLKDDPKEMTRGRRIALYLMKRYKWYNPRLALDEENEGNPLLTPSFEQSSSANHMIDEEEKEGENDKINSNAAQPIKVSAINSEDTDSGATANMSFMSTKSKRQKPQLEKAWAFFEHMSLARYIVPPDEDESLEEDNDADRKKIFSSAWFQSNKFFKYCCKGDVQLDRAAPGEKYQKTKMYDPVFTPLSQCGDFGLAFGLYFLTLRFFTALMLVCGIINISNIVYFSSEEYSSGQPGVSNILNRGSAICTNTVWQPCPDCTYNDFDNNPTRYANTTSSVDGSTISFALRNECDGAIKSQGFVNFFTLLCIMIAIAIMNFFQKRRTVAFDEDEQTAQDYSIIIKNPPDDAYTPEEWKEFFESNFDDIHVTTCTVAVDNDLLVKSLIKRREALRKLELSVKPGTSMDVRNLARIAAEEEQTRSIFKKILSLVLPGIPELYGSLVVMTAKVQGLAQLNYPTRYVYVTFETEAAQRQVLTSLSVGLWKAKRLNKKLDRGIIDSNDQEINGKPVFRNKRVLLVYEPEEPTTVRWDNLNVKSPTQIKQLTFTYTLCFGIMAIVAIIIFQLNKRSIILGALAIALANLGFPEIAKHVTFLFESFASESAKQTSLYIKVGIFRWFNTAILYTIIKPFTTTLQDEGGLIPAIYTIFFTEIVTTTFIQLSDAWNHIQRHVLAPRAPTQDRMNMFMRGSAIEIAERYTNMTKIVFLTMWYNSIYPVTFFMCSVALLINFFADKYCLMRTWRRAPQLGTTLAKVSRNYFFPAAIVASAVASSYFWAGFPYDNLCETDQGVSDNYVGTFTLTSGIGETVDNVVVEGGDLAYRYCLQDLLRKTSGRTFPAIPKNQPVGGEWMTDEQETLTSVYGTATLVIMAFVICSLLVNWFASLRKRITGKYSPQGEDQHINFSDVQAIDTFVPQVKSGVFSYPLIACNFDGIDPGLLDWTDPDRPHSYYDLTKDCDELLKGIRVSARHVFSQVQYWPPEAATSAAPEGKE